MAARDPTRELFDFERVGLGNFEVWDRTVHAPAGQGKKVAFISVRVGGAVGMNRAAHDMPTAIAETVFITSEAEGRLLSDGTGA